MDFSQKTIIFCAPSDFGFSDVIKQALQNQGFTVYDFPVLDTPYVYKRISERLYNTYRKLFFKDAQYKRHLKMLERNQILSKKLKDTPDTTFALFIRPDLFPLEFVKTVKNKVKITAGYQWDGLNRFPQVFDYINLFDRFFVFDAEDLNIKRDLLPLTNFFIDKKSNRNLQKTAYFIASYDDYRFELINNLKNIIIKTDLIPELYFITKDKKQIQKLLNSGLTIENPLTYLENLERVEAASLLIDIHSPTHTGLSFRIFEALNYNKKLITTNTEVVKYDFYHPNNIFIWDTKNENQILEFLKSDFVEISDEIKNKYSFTNWINYVLDINTYLPIKHPNFRN